MNARSDSPESEIAADHAERIREQERRGRDAGAGTYLDNIAASRGAFRMRVEDLAVRQAVAPRPQDDVLDAGAGVGRHALAMARQARRIVCADFSAASLAVLRQQAESRGLRNIETVVADVCDLPADLGRFHVAYSCEVFQHIPTHALRLKGLREIGSRLVAGGRCVVTALAWNRRSKGDKEGVWENGAYRFRFSPEEMAALFTEAGFARVVVRGMVVLPGAITRFMPLSWAALDAGLSRLPGTERVGAFVIAVGRM